ncbi:hypothetical protein F2Q69_00042386 [Brassica cretica]|uniref:Uncharacterized protein n=1 Tax=Brassica cretica TaxID=69181 RepID=A0A8S9NM15_BRACR|nr:hypothetical protein F2Q69_00042386 [Brassica cretica]
MPPSIDRRPEFGRRAFDLFGARKFYWDDKDEYGIYREDQGCARDIDRHIIDIYAKDEINEMFYGVCGGQEKYEGNFQMKLDGVYHPLKDSIGWVTTCMEEMRQDIAKIQQVIYASRQISIDRNHHASIGCRLPTSIDQRLPPSVDNSPPDSPPMKSPQDFHTMEEIDQLVEGIYRALDTTWFISVQTLIGDVMTSISQWILALVF